MSCNVSTSLARRERRSIQTPIIFHRILLQENIAAAVVCKPHTGVLSLFRSTTTQVWDHKSKSSLKTYFCDISIMKPSLAVLPIGVNVESNIVVVVVVVRLLSLNLWVLHPQHNVALLQRDLTDSLLQPRMENSKLKGLIERGSRKDHGNQSFSFLTWSLWKNMSPFFWSVLKLKLA